jgi:hypothetical protein
MTSLTREQLVSDRTNFMGMPVEGNYGGWARAVQEPIENLYPYFKDAFANGVKAVKWQQYTPGWNDGEPCEFSISDVYVTSNEVVAAAWLDNTEPDWEVAYPEQELDYYEDYLFSEGRYGGHPDGDEIGKLPLPVDHGQFEDALRGVFGNDTEVVVTPERVVQFEYDCGY